MCGINGFFCKNKLKDGGNRIIRMNSSIQHRGPDYSSYVSFLNKIYLGHARLSILDVSSKGNQPMVSSSGIYTIVYNGEIYNYNDMKEHLTCNFISSTDTELILEYISQYGIDKFLEYANGMFSFALYNNKNNNLILARDRLGIKPLYYSFVNEKLIFSSEIKGILNSGLVEPIFDINAIDEYLGNRYVREPNTFFKNIKILESGSYLTINENLDMEKTVYWTLPKKINFDSEYDEDKIAFELKSLLEDSIKLRMISDVNLGTYLSGGVDSSLITAIVAKNSDTPINSYTIGFQEYNEFSYSDLVADLYKTSNHKIIVNSQKYIEMIDELIKYKDAPLAVPNEILLAIMSKELKKKITVVLSGEGADELLGGYGRIFRSPFDYKNHRNNFSNFYDFFIDKYEYVPRTLRDKYFNISFDYRRKYDSFYKKKFKMNSNEYNVFNFFHFQHIKGLLQRVDTTTMYASVEARVPFLDHRLIEYSYKNIPYDLKLKWNSTESKIKATNMTSIDYSEKLDKPKYILKKIAYDYLPTEVIERKKVGFPVPLNQWADKLEEIFRQCIVNREWFKIEDLDEFIIDINNNCRKGQILWMLINLCKFQDIYFYKKWLY